MIRCLLTVLTLFFSFSIDAIPPPPEKPTFEPIQEPYIIGDLHDQLGNQMFEIAATLSVALDHGAQAVFPNLETKRPLYANYYDYVFWRLNPSKIRGRRNNAYKYMDLPYKPIPYTPNMKLVGYFQSEKYFIHHKEEVLSVFRPHESIVQYIHKKHPWFKDLKNSVSVHLRAYYPIHPSGKKDGGEALRFLGKEYFLKAMMMFPNDHTFIIFSDNIPWCKKNLSDVPRNLIFIENQPNFLDLFMMSMCQHHIISNSTFSWWGAYMNPADEKIVIAPKKWFLETAKETSEDIVPDDWIRID